MITRVTAGNLKIRKGKTSDLAQVREFAQKTFSWGDYLPQAWNDWVRSKRGTLLVAELENQVVGTIHVRYLEHREAWLEGVRVHPEFRQRGVASALIRAAHADAASKKCRVIRLETGAWNRAAQRAFEKFGYRRIVTYGGYKGDAQPGELGTVHLATSRDLAMCWQAWQSSWVKRASKTIVPAVYGWRWWELTRARLLNDIRSERVWVAPRGFMILRELNHDFDITLLVGTKRDAMNLLHAGRVLAQQGGREDIFWIVPLGARAQNWATAAGYQFDDDGLEIYACAL